MCVCVCVVHVGAGMWGVHVCVVCMWVRECVYVRVCLYRIGICDRFKV